MHGGRKDAFDLPTFLKYRLANNKIYDRIRHENLFGRKLGGKMFAYIKGKLETKSDTFVVIDVQGVGYKIFMPSKTIETMGELGQLVKVYTYYYVREDNISLYGFLTNEELRMFELLLSVSRSRSKICYNHAFGN